MRREALLDQLCLWSFRAFSAGDPIVPFRAAATHERPARLTLQVSEHEHMASAPSALTFTNHSCDPNAYFDVERWELIALSPIAAGDAITSSYPATEWTMASPFDCVCGSPRCLGRIHRGITTAGTGAPGPAPRASHHAAPSRSEARSLKSSSSASFSLRSSSIRRSRKGEKCPAYFS